jgi:3-deoxy-manno-octulosonate cytidylyltransferase (CMP-KDO synthetase)
MYFSRSPIPYVRDGEPDLQAATTPFLQHVGLYAYRRAFLMRFATLPAAALEQQEKLEQLCALANGCRIRVGLTASSTLGVYTMEDYRRFVELYRQSQTNRAA